MYQTIDIDQTKISLIYSFAIQAGGMAPSLPCNSVMKWDNHLKKLHVLDTYVIWNHHKMPTYNSLCIHHLDLNYLHKDGNYASILSVNYA